jgi:NADPH-dependent 7-cyano-7-deazaguanine reductase QueF
MVTLLTQPNTRLDVQTLSVHRLPFSGMCPISGNPQIGSVITIRYRAKDCFLEVYSLRAYLEGYKGGKGDIRDMEGMIQQTATDCAQALGVVVTVKANIALQRGDWMQVIARIE